MRAHQIHVLISRPDHLGDALLTLPAVTALRQSLPGARLTMLVPDAVGAVPRHCPDIDRTMTLPFPPLTVPFDAAEWELVVSEAAGALAGRFDLALVPRPDDPWSGQLVAALDIPSRLGYATPCTQPYLTSTLPVPRERHAAGIALDLAAAAVRLLGGPAVDPDQRDPPRFQPTPAEAAEAESVLRATTVGGSAPIILHPGSGWPLKNWPASRWGELAITLRGRYGVRPLVTGSQAEADLTATVVAASGGQAIDLAGRLSLGALAALHARARLVIATDSGPLHLAAAMGAPVVGLYGPASSATFSPWCSPARYRIVRVPLPCAPCGALLGPPCGAATEPACVTSIPVSAVLDAATDLLAV